ncbi:GntR family transcriptional regulator [Salmonella enterica subsp. enterica serovar Newport]|uniref:GntR family transcriptional regulator n=1 Tax=Salmonella newport TaxID=108619 RepID=A0A5X6LDB0_SALNE|nr:GntR family transcriptional regulator [Salmonella enterica subsp. enterica serovar Newport]EBQ9422316.1 GntR family transcriptional regulator [Salmonella enterica subsp. enterica serovar Newport]EBS1164817.1 GntR family transcriptional regulator [Salmonella enterica subsp. enterica serovar Newport]EBS6022256.1 GntR family transcriptional regulator [Salmonella enterica subsp. enterica serovar Newport]EBU8125263.1 GntR family transcriptional regulator [Salmonella enterica subsp. enterica serov
MKKKEFVAQDLLSKIYQEDAPGPRKLSPERQLAEEYGVSRFTIRKALEKLAGIGVVQIVQGSGTWVNESAHRNPLVYNSITAKCFDQIRYRLISLHKKRPDREAQQIFGIDDESFIWHFCRLRYIDETPVQLEISSMPVADFPGLNQQAIEGSIQQYVLSKGLTISHMLTTYRAVNVSREQAMLLGCRKGSPAMHINNRGILNNGKVFEVSDIIDINYICTYVIPYNRDNLTRRQNHGV